MPEYLFDKLSRARLSKRDAIREAAEARVLRDELAPDGKLLILAADHPARYVTNVGERSGQDGRSPRVPLPHRPGDEKSSGGRDHGDARHHSTSSFSSTTC